MVSKPPAAEGNSRHTPCLVVQSCVSNMSFSGGGLYSSQLGVSPTCGAAGSLFLPAAVKLGLAEPGLRV